MAEIFAKIKDFFVMCWDWIVNAFNFVCTKCGAFLETLDQTVLNKIVAVLSIACLFIGFFKLLKVGKKHKKKD